MIPRPEPRVQRFFNPETKKTRHLLMVPDHLGSLRPMLDGETGKPVDFSAEPNGQGRIDGADIQCALGVLDRAKRASALLIAMR